MSTFGAAEPTNRQKSLVDEALYLRGRIVASYAQVEFLLADISVKLDLRFPFQSQGCAGTDGAGRRTAPRGKRECRATAARLNYDMAL
jgi:hypothetical protein